MSSIYSKEYQQIIHALKTIRIKQGITQQTLAKALGRPQSFIAKIENGERRLDVVEFIRITQLLAINPNHILSQIIIKDKPLL